jgi:alkylation response protein AidB-like acyl-CoA dehydrogenase
MPCAFPLASGWGRRGRVQVRHAGARWGRINIASCSLGTAQQALNDALAHVQQRQQFGHPISEFQSVQFRLADMATELAAARLLVRQAAAKLDGGSPDKSAWCAMAKRFATDVGHRICDDALQLFGGYGYIREYPLERYLRDTRVHRILEGTNEVMRLIIARRLLADPGCRWSSGRACPDDAVGSSSGFVSQPQVGSIQPCHHGAGF